MSRPSLLVPVLLLAGCDPVGLMCTEIGCQSSAVLTVTGGGAPLLVFSGTVTVGDTTYDVACDGSDSTGSSPEVFCGGDGTVAVPAPDGGADLTWSLSGSPGAGASYSGDGAASPEWTSYQPNGEDCPPTCWSAEVEAALELD